MGSVGWYDDNSGRKTHPVGQKSANELGIYDMSGNVYEWVWDWYDGYPSGSATDPPGGSSGSGRVLRGGSWSFIAGFCRVAFRGGISPDYAGRNLGFRVVAFVRNGR